MKQRRMNISKKPTRATTVLMLVVSVLLSLSTPLQAWAAETPSTAEDIRSIVTDTTWYDPSTGSACALNGVNMSGTSEFLTGNPIPLRYPSITDNAKFAAAMEKFIRDTVPGSPWLAIPDMGTKFVQEGMTRDVNPMLVIAIGMQETRLGTAANSSAVYKNSFGYKGANPPGSPNTDYKIFPTFEASLFGEGSFTQRIQYNLSGQHPNYKEVQNMYEYISVHLSGQIIYPGDSTTSYDSTMGVVIDADGENGYAGPIQYFQHAIEWIGKITGLTITGTPTKGGSCGGCQTKVGDISIAFPVEPCTKRSYTDLPCGNSPRSYSVDPNVAGFSKTETIVTCHHDGSPAYDLYFDIPKETTEVGLEKYSNMGGKKVFAITDGRIQNADLSLYGIQGCNSVQFYSTTQNRYYWYGHLQNVDKYVKGGQEGIKAGQPIAEVGNMTLKHKGCSPGPPHLHIDRGCANTKGTADVHDDTARQGGNDPCRDGAFMEELLKVWEGLPPDAS